MKVYLETERLLLREMEISDAPAMVDLDSDPEVMRYLSEGGRASTPEEITSAIGRTLDLYKKHNGKFGLWITIEKSSNEPIGWFLFRPSKNTQRIEIGYRFKKKFWGKGFATEGSLALMKKGFEEFNVAEIYAGAMKDNTSSTNVMKKIGLTFKKEFISTFFPDSNLLEVEYSITRKEWNEMRRNR